MLVYKNRSHYKTVELVGEIVSVAMKNRNNQTVGRDQLTIPKNGMTEYHLGYIIEKLEEIDFAVELTQGINTFNLHIEWDDTPDDLIGQSKFFFDHNYNEDDSSLKFAYKLMDEIGRLKTEIKELEDELDNIYSDSYCAGNCR
jgi:hypothetical protein